MGPPCSSLIEIRNTLAGQWGLIAIKKWLTIGPLTVVSWMLYVTILVITAQNSVNFFCLAKHIILYNYYISTYLIIRLIITVIVYAQQLTGTRRLVELERFGVGVNVLNLI